MLLEDERPVKKARTEGPDTVVTTLAVPHLGDVMWLAVDPVDGVTLFVCTHYAIMTVSPTGVMALLAGGKQGFKDGQGREARFNIPRGIAGFCVCLLLFRIAGVVSYDCPSPSLPSPPISSHSGQGCKPARCRLQ